jgi:opacity protein-like surface antigen
MFNKIFLAGLLAVTLSQASDEFSSERLLGIEVGYASLNSNSDKVNKKVNGVEYGLRIGAQNEEWRTTLVGNFYTEGSHKYQRVMLEFDRFVWASLYETDNIVFKPYLGGHIGWMKYTDDFSLSDNSMVYGGQAGLAWNVLNQVDFDLGYRYSIVDMPNVDDIGAVTLGVNYIY